MVPTDLNRKMVAYDDLLAPELIADTMSPPIIFFNDIQMREGMRVFKKVHEQMYFPYHRSRSQVGRDLLFMNWFTKDKERTTLATEIEDEKQDIKQQKQHFPPGSKQGKSPAASVKPKKKRDNRQRSNIKTQMYWACSCCNSPLIEIKKLISNNQSTKAWKKQIMLDFPTKFTNMATTTAAADDCWLVNSYGFHKPNCSCVTYTIPKKTMGIVTWDLPEFFMDHIPRMKTIGVKWYNHVKGRGTQVIDDHVEEPERKRRAKQKSSSQNEETKSRHYGVYHRVDHPDGKRIPGVQRKIKEYKYNREFVFGRDSMFAGQFGLLFQLVIKMRFHLTKSFHEEKNYMGDQGFIAGGNAKQSLHCDHEPKDDNSLIDEDAEQERLGYLVSIPGVVVVPLAEKGGVCTYSKQWIQSTIIS